MLCHYDDTDIKFVAFNYRPRMGLLGQGANKHLLFSPDYTLVIYVQLNDIHNRHGPNGRGLHIEKLSFYIQ